jgi:hypothetical protein
MALSLKTDCYFSKSIGNAKACEIKPSTMAAVLNWLTKSLKKFALQLTEL